MAFADQGFLVLRQPGQQREFLALHCRFDAPQAGAAHQHFMRGEDQAQRLPILHMSRFPRRSSIATTPATGWR